MQALDTPAPRESAQSDLRKRIRDFPTIMKLPRIRVANAHDIASIHGRPTSTNHASQGTHRSCARQSYERLMQHDAGMRHRARHSGVSGEKTRRERIHCALEFYPVSVLTVRFSNSTRTRQPLRGTATSPSVVLHILGKQGAANVLTEGYRLNAARQYTLSGFIRALPRILPGSIK